MKKIGVFLLVIFGTVLTLMIFTFLPFFQENLSKKNVYLPSTTELAMRVSPKELLVKELYYGVFISKDEKLDRFIRTIYDENKLNSQDNTRLYFDPKQEIIFFSFESNKKKCLGINFTSLDGEKCKANFLAKKLKNIGIFVKNKEVYLYQYADDLNSGKPFFPKTKKWVALKKRNKDHFMSFYSKKEKEAPFDQFSMQTKFFENQFKIIGTGKGKIKSGSLNQLKSKGIYCVMYGIPIGMKEQISKVVQLKNNDLQACVIDYQGMYLTKDIKGQKSIAGFNLFPKINGLFQFKNDVNVEEIKALFPKEYQTKTGLNFRDFSYNLDQIDSKTIFIGENKSLILAEKEDRLLHISGDFKVLLNIQSTDPMISMMDALEPVRVLKGFLKKTKKITFTLDKFNKIHGEISFNKKENALHELSCFMISIYELSK